MAVTQRDIAREVGVSQTVVSDVLQGRPRGRVRPEVRDRILDAARRLEYQPNASARALRSRQSRQVVYVALQPEGRTRSLLGEEVLPGLVEALAEQDHRVLLHVALREADVVPSLRSMLSAGQGDGFVFRGVDLSRTLLDELKALGHPFAVIGQCAAEEVASVAHDAEAMVCDLVACMLGQGHRRLLLLDQPGTSDYDRLVRQAWSAEVARHGLQATAVPAESRGVAESLATQWLGEPDLSGAIIARNEALYVGATAAAKRWGRQWGQGFDMGVLGAVPRDWVLEPGTWCVAPRHDEIGRIAGREVLRQLDGEPPAGPVRLRPEPYRA